MSFRTDAANRAADRLIAEINREKVRQEALLGVENQRLNDQYNRQATDINALHNQVIPHNTGLTNEINQDMAGVQGQVGAANQALQQHLQQSANQNKNLALGELQRLGLNKSPLSFAGYDDQVAQQLGLSQQRAGFEQENLANEQMRLNILGDQLSGLNESGRATGLERADFERDAELEANRLGWEDYLNEIAMRLEDAEFQRQMGLEDAALLDGQKSDFVPFEPYSFTPWGSNFTPWGSNFTPWGSNFTPWGSGGSTYGGDFETPTDEGGGGGNSGPYESGVPGLEGMRDIGANMQNVIDQYYRDAAEDEWYHDQETAYNADSKRRALAGHTSDLPAGQYAPTFADIERERQSRTGLVGSKGGGNLRREQDIVQNELRRREMASAVAHDKARATTEKDRAAAVRPKVTAAERAAAAKVKARKDKQKRLKAAAKRRAASRKAFLKRKRQKQNKKRNAAIRARSAREAASRRRSIRRVDRGKKLNKSRRRLNARNLGR